MVISVRTFGPNAATSPCSVAPNTISCNGTFKYYPSVTYNWNEGDITMNGLP